MIDCDKDCPYDPPVNKGAVFSEGRCCACNEEQLQKAEAEIGRLKKEISLHADALCKVSNAASMAMDDVEYWICDFDSERPEDIDEVQKVVDEYRIGAYHGKQTGHWTKEPPTEPGWYRIHDKHRYGFGFARVANGNNGLIYQLDGIRDEQPLTEDPFIKWYSEKETFPPLPDDRGEDE